MFTSRLSDRVARRALLLACLLAGGTARAADAPIDPQAQKVVDAFGKFYGATQGFRVTDTVSVYVSQQGREMTREFVQKLAAERPNRFLYLLESDQGGAQVVSDGRDLSVYLNALGRYAVEPAPASFAAMLENQLILGAISLGNAATVTVALLAEDPAARLLEGATSVRYGGIEEVAGAKCHRIDVVTEKLDWQVWIDAGEQPLVRQFVPDLEKAFAKMAKAANQKSPLENMRVKNTVTYADWEIDPKFGDDGFAFHLPEGATKVDTFMDILAAPARPAAPPVSPLLGKPAPPIDLELLDGGKLDLASFKNKNVVILDFWATWCGPCVQAMPLIDKVAQQFEHKGVKLFAVNIQEGNDEISAFLEKAQLEVAVALDKEGSVAAAYGANAIPQTVLIGKDGSVQVVKVGLSQNLEQELTESLAALVAGEDLAAKTLADAKKRPAGAPATDGAQSPEAEDAKTPRAKSAP